MTNIKGFAILPILIVLAVALAGAGIWVYQAQVVKPKSEFVPAVKKDVQRPESGQAMRNAKNATGTVEIQQIQTASADDENNDKIKNTQIETMIFPEGINTVGWKTYRSDTYGFEFKYPPTIESSLNSSGGFLYLSASKSIIVNASNDSELENCHARMGYVESDSKIKINGIVFGRQTGMAFGPSGVDGQDVIEKASYSTVEGGKCVIVEFAVNHDKVQKALPNKEVKGTYNINNEPEIKILEQILSTFKFINGETAYKEDVIGLKDGKGKMSGSLKDIYYKNGSTYLDIDLLRWFNGLNDCSEIKLPDCGPINFYTNYYAEGNCGKKNSVLPICGPSGVATIDESDKITTFKIAENVEIMVVDLQLKDQYQKISLDKFIELLNNDPSKSDAPFWSVRKNGIYHIEINNGMVTKIVDQYTP